MKTLQILLDYHLSTWICLAHSLNSMQCHTQFELDFVPKTLGGLFEALSINHLALIKFFHIFVFILSVRQKSISSSDVKLL